MSEVNGIVYAGTKADMLRIQDAKVTGRMMMLITFSTGEQRVFDAEVFHSEVFEPLKDDAVFRNFKIVRSTITWQNEKIDCAPEYMYDHSFPYDSFDIATPDPDELEALREYRAGNPEYQPYMSHEDLKKELGL